MHSNYFKVAKSKEGAVETDKAKAKSYPELQCFHYMKNTSLCLCLNAFGLLGH
jgi:hypothetical protein